MANLAVTDFHGNRELGRKILQEMTHGGDNIYYLGDAVDRGPHGFRILNELMNDPRVIYIKGNHDDMFAGSAIYGDRFYKRVFDGCADFEHWIKYCGGDTTYDDWQKSGGSLEIPHKLDQALTHYTLVTERGVMLLSHAGYTPRRDDPGDIPAEDWLLWDRGHFNDPWELGDKDVFVIHGHTPVDVLRRMLGMDYKLDPVFYSEGHKICIDAGTYLNDSCFLFNLDDFSWKIVTA